LEELTHLNESCVDKSITLGHPSYVWRFGQDRRLDLINRYAPLAGKRLLDVGCGLGMYVRKFHAFSAATFGVDIDLEKLAEAAETLPNLAQSPTENLPFPANSFDVILLHEVIEHMHSDQEAIAEAHRCLKPGGRLAIFAPNRLYPLETHGFYLGKRYYFARSDRFPSAHTGVAPTILLPIGQSLLPTGKAGRSGRCAPSQSSSRYRGSAPGGTGLSSAQ
jgi:SAM-dependent methyltransferase